MISSFSRDSQILRYANWKTYQVGDSTFSRSSTLWTSPALYNLWQWIFQLWVHVIRQKARRECGKSKGENFPFIRQIKFAKAKKAFHLNKHNPRRFYVLKISRLMSRWGVGTLHNSEKFGLFFALLLFLRHARTRGTNLDPIFPLGSGHSRRHKQEKEVFQGQTFSLGFLFPFSCVILHNELSSQLHDFPPETKSRKKSSPWEWL